jgi:hypothetical protein
METGITCGGHRNFHEKHENARKGDLNALMNMPDCNDMIPASQLTEWNPPFVPVGVFRGHRFARPPAKPD